MPARSRGLNSTRQGKRFEWFVMDWAFGRRFEKLLLGENAWSVVEVERNKLVSGMAAKRPYEVDVSVKVEGPLNLILQRQTAHIWIECKNRLSTVKRGDIAKLDAAGMDVAKATAENREDTKYVAWLLVSSTPFDSDAILYASQVNIGCIYYDGRGFRPQNESLSPQAPWS